MRFLTPLLLAVLTSTAWAAALEDLTVEPENRCSPYNSDVRKADYGYSWQIELDIVRKAGFQVDRRGNLDRPFPSPYKKDVWFNSIKETDIEHIIPVSEAHDSGLCDPNKKEQRHQIAQDLDNLTIALPSTNREEKWAYDPAEWLPEINQCAYAQTWVNVKHKYDLSVDQAEYDALADVLSGCAAIPQE